jgi:hypothetical protein
VLYLFKIKDEGIMFYFGRAVVRLGDPNDLPRAPGPQYCVLTDEEWRNWSSARLSRVVERMQDAQGDGMILVCVQ